MRPVWMLSATQALCMSGSFLFVLLGGIIGSQPGAVAGARDPAGLLADRRPRGERRAGRRPDPPLRPPRRVRRLRAAGGRRLRARRVRHRDGPLLALLRRGLPARRQQRGRHAVPLRRNRIRGAGAREPRDRGRHERRARRRLARARARRAHGGPRAGRALRGFLLRGHRALPACGAPARRGSATLPRTDGPNAAPPRRLARDRRAAGVPRRGARRARVLYGDELHHDGDADQHARRRRARRGRDRARDPGPPARHVPAVARQRLDHREVRRAAGDRRRARC